MEDQRVGPSQEAFSWDSVADPRISNAGRLGAQLLNRTAPDWDLANQQVAARQAARQPQYSQPGHSGKGGKGGMGGMGQQQQSEELQWGLPSLMGFVQQMQGGQQPQVPYGHGQGEQLAFNQAQAFRRAQERINGMGQQVQGPYGYGQGPYGHVQEGNPLLAGLQRGGRK